MGRSSACVTIFNERKVNLLIEMRLKKSVYVKNVDTWAAGFEEVIASDIFSDLNGGKIISKIKALWQTTCVN